MDNYCIFYYEYINGDDKEFGGFLRAKSFADAADQLELYINPDLKAITCLTYCGDFSQVHAPVEIARQMREIYEQRTV